MTGPTRVGVLEVVGVGSAVPAVRSATSTRAASSIAGSTAPQARESAGDGFGGVVLGVAHASILHAT
ncbi:hypothetical protein AKH00_16695 [Microbacterium sp. GCS4]|nr:hypothetical protein AKH00_16695 [Microbacterium sp. GCS4]